MARKEESDTSYDDSEELSNDRETKVKKRDKHNNAWRSNGKWKMENYR